MAVAVQRDDVHVEVGENQGLAFEIIWGNRGQESGSDLDCAVDRENVGTRRAGVVVRHLVSSGEVHRIAHPRVDSAIDTDETSPSKSGAARELLLVGLYTNSCSKALTPRR